MEYWRDGVMRSPKPITPPLHTPRPQFPVSLTKQQVAFIRSARVAHLATADASDQPHVIPICFVFDGQNFYSPIDEKPKRNLERELKRLRNIRENPNAALTIDHYEEDWRRLAYVLIVGRARILAGGKNHQHAVRLLRRKYPQYREMAIDRRPMIRITPRRVRTWGNV
jgi:PPOX class probable F420-dependent enzyme